MPWDLRFNAMGTQAHLLVEGSADLLPLPCHEINRLERLWSRFIADSDVSRMNGAGGAPTKVAPETIELIERASEGWTMTEGLFDPTLLNELVAAGYDRDFDELRAHGGGAPPAVHPRRPAGPGFPVSTDAGTSTASIAAEAGFDSGGIGKGLAADMVVDRLLSEGASAALANLGGDLRAAGTPPDGAWIVGVNNPFDAGGAPALQLSLSDRALATTTSLLRRWRQADRERHHLIDPATGEPCESDIASVTVIADRGWRAEVLAKAAFISGVDRALPLLASKGATGLLVDLDGRILLAPGIEAHLVAPAHQIASIQLKERAFSNVSIRLPA